MGLDRNTVEFRRLVKIQRANTSATRENRYFEKALCGVNRALMCSAADGIEGYYRKYTNARLTHPGPRESSSRIGIPRSGIIQPRLGMPSSSMRPAASRSKTGLADALFSSTQQRVLALLFGQPDRSFYASELIRLAASGSGGVQRELAKLEESGLVTVRRVGSQKHYQANPTSPLFEELRGIVRKTVGLAEPLREALRPLSKDIFAAFVYGSVAKRKDTARSDIDVLIVSDKLTYADIFAALEPVRARLQREINPTVYGREDIGRRLKAGNAFMKRVLNQPKLWIIGSKRDLAA